MAQFVALLRGINVGGSNLIRMADLKTCFEKHGFGNVATYIASGNVLFDSNAPPSKLVAQVEAMLGGAFTYDASVVILGAAQLKKIVEKAPKGFGTEPDRFRDDVWFLKPPLTAAAAIRALPTKEGVDRVWPGPGAIYTSRLASKATQSRLARIVGTPTYKNLTIRNWNTTTTLLRLLSGRSGSRV
jgi:uncharacterized protein (DUF1697 family)